IWADEWSGSLSYKTCNTTVANSKLFYPRQPFLPDFVKLHRGADVAQAVFGDLAEFLLGHQRAHVHAGHARALGRFYAEGFAVKIQVEPPRRAVASAHAVKRQLLREVAVRLHGVTVAEPVLFRDRHVEQRRAQINERHVEAAPVEGDDVVVMFRHVPKSGEQFGLVGHGQEFHRSGLARVVLEIFGEINRLAAQRLSVEHGDAHDLRRERPQAHEPPDFLALGGLGDGVVNFLRLAEQIFLLRLVEIFNRLRGGFDVEYKGGHKSGCTSCNPGEDRPPANLLPDGVNDWGGELV